MILNPGIGRAEFEVDGLGPLHARHPGVLILNRETCFGATVSFEVACCLREICAASSLVGGLTFQQIGNGLIERERKLQTAAGAKSFPVAR